MKKVAGAILCLEMLVITAGVAEAKSTKREKPEEWKKLVHGGRFIDRILRDPI